MKKIFLTLSFLVLISFSYAQKTIAVLSGTTWTFYDDFSPALRGAPAGSTIYVPGGTFDLGGNDTINKPLTIIGTGFSVDSTAATLSTVLIGSLYYSTGANYTTLIGLDIAGAINSISGIVYNNTIDRCRIRSSVTLYNTVTSKFLNILIKESVIEDDLNASSSDVINLTVEKCILFKEMSLQIGAVIKNNYFVNNFCSGCSRSNTFRFVDNSFFENNVIITSYSSPFTASDNNTIKNNLFITSTSISTTNQVYNNLFGATLANTFLNVTSTTFQQNFDYHLKASSLGINAGSDGTNMGIYGTTYPCKDGWVPPNPHISTKAIAPTSASNGTLPVNIKVVAQDR